MTAHRTRSLALASLLVTSIAGAFQPVQAQMPGGITEMSGRYKDQETRAADAYARGLRAQRKADQLAAQSQAEKARKSYDTAKREYQKAIGLQSGYFDALLGLGQVQLALGQRESALDACRHALGLKPSHPDARACLDAASAPVPAAPSH